MQYISSRSVAADIKTDLDLSIETGWGAKMQKWISSVVKRLRAVKTMETLGVDVKVPDSGCIELPCYIYMLYAVKHNNKPLSWGKKTWDSAIHTSNNLTKHSNYKYTYVLDGNVIKTDVPSCETIVIVGRAFKTDEKGWLYIPDIEEVHLSIRHYILAMLMLRGIEFPNLGLSYYDCMKIYENYLEDARGTISNSYNRDEKEAIIRGLNRLNKLEPQIDYYTNGEASNLRENESY